MFKIETRMRDKQGNFSLALYFNIPIFGGVEIKRTVDSITFRVTNQQVKRCTHYAVRGQSWGT